MSKIKITLKDFKVLHKLTLEEISNRSGLSISSLSKIQNNQMALSNDSLTKLNNVYPEFEFISSMEVPKERADVWKEKYYNLENELIKQKRINKNLSNKLKIAEHKLTLISNTLSRVDVDVLQRDIITLEKYYKEYYKDRYDVIAIADADDIVFHFLVEKEEFQNTIKFINEQINYYINVVQSNETLIEELQVDNIYEYISNYVIQNEVGINIHLMHI